MKNHAKGMGNTQFLVVCLVIAAAISGAGVYLLLRFTDSTGPIGEVEDLTFTNENFGFSVTYPSNWTANGMSIYGNYRVLFAENESEGEANAQVQVVAGDLQIPPLDNLKESIPKMDDNNENLSIIKGPEEVTIEDLQGLDFSFKNRIPQERFRGRQIVIYGDNIQYSLNSIVRENFNEEFKLDLKRIIESFELL